MGEGWRRPALLISSSLTVVKICVPCVGMWGQKGDKLGEGMRPVVSRKRGSQHATWDQSRVRFAPSTDGHSPK
jgi:hypothetical protein